MENYLGGDIISGMVATGIYKKEKINAFFDIGTNGELVLGNRDFLLCGAGAAGPALEGGVVKTGMRAMEGAVDRVKMEGNGERNLRIRDCGSSGGIVFAWMDRYPGDLTAGEKPVDRGERRDAGGELCTGAVFLPE